MLGPGREGVSVSGRTRWIALSAAVVVIALIIAAIQMTVAPSPSAPGSSSAAGLLGSGSSEDVGRKGPAAPEFTGVARWLNSPPLTLADLEGRVVLVDFWTYTCVNCLRTLPYLRDWQDKYAANGLVIVGVHSPEFEFEKVEANVREAIAREGITWPVAQDNDFGTWRAYANRYWPHKFLIDRDGSVRYDHIGEGGYRETEIQIRSLLTEAGYDVDGIPVGGVDAAPVNRQPITRELYAGTGWDVGGYLGNPGPSLVERTTTFVDGSGHEDGRFYLHGEWESDSESVRHSRATEGFEDYVALGFTAASVNIVVRPEGDTPFPVVATLNGGPIPEDDRGDDIGVDDQGRTFFLVDSPRMYSVVRAREVAFHELRLRVNSTDFVLYTFTFGA